MTCMTRMNITTDGIDSSMLDCPGSDRRGTVDNSQLHKPRGDHAFLSVKAKDIGCRV